MNKLHICRTTPRPKSLLDRLRRNPDAEIYLGDIRVKPHFTKETQFWTDANTGVIICEELDAELRKLGGPLQTGVTGQPSRRNSWTREISTTAGSGGAISGTENVVHVFRNVRRRDDIDNNDVSFQSMKSRVGSQYPLKNTAGHASPGLPGANPAPNNMGLNATSSLSFGVSDYIPSVSLGSSVNSSSASTSASPTPGPSKKLPLSGTQFFPDAGSATEIENHPTNWSNHSLLLTPNLESSQSGSYSSIRNYTIKFM